MRPRFALEGVRATARTKRGLKLGFRKCLFELHELFDTDSECYRFARDVLDVLSPDDFIGSVPIPDMRATSNGEPEDYDAYAVRLPDRLLERHGIAGRTTWYVKLTLRTEGEDQVFCLSLHKLRRPEPRRVGGCLHPEW